MEVSLNRQVKPYPRYMYHRDHDEPKVVYSKVEEAELGTKGWITAYIHKEYPKWVGDKIVNSFEEEERLLASQQPQMADASQIEEIQIEVPSFDASADVFTEPGSDVTVVKETQVEGQDPTMIEKPKRKYVKRSKEK